MTVSRGTVDESWRVVSVLRDDVAWTRCIVTVLKVGYKKMEDTILRQVRSNECGAHKNIREKQFAHFDTHTSLTPLSFATPLSFLLRDLAGHGDSPCLPRHFCHLRHHPPWSTHSLQSLCRPCFLLHHGPSLLHRSDR